MCMLQDYPSRCIEPGKSDHMHYINLDKEQEMSAMVNRVSWLSKRNVYTVTVTAWKDCVL